METEPRPESLHEIYSQYFADQHLKKIRGKLYQNPYPGVAEHQFFLSRDPMEGVIFYGGDTLNCHDVMYDLYRDKLIVYEPSIGGLVELHDEFVLRFRLTGPDDDIYEFTVLDQSPDTARVRESAYYQLLYRGDSLDLFKRHAKFLSEKPQDNSYVIQFKKQESLWIMKGGRYYPLRRNRDLFRIYPGVDDDIKRFLLKRFMNKTGIDLRQASVEQVQQIGRYMDRMEGYSDFLNPEL
jgi:hypothetical protein